MMCAQAVLAQNRLKPVSRFDYEFWNGFFEIYYDKKWKGTQYLVCPSFGAQYALRIPNSNNANPKQLLVFKDGKNYTVDADEVVIAKLCYLVEDAINTSMFPFDRMGNDGVNYFFMKYDKSATCWSPDTGNCKVLINLFDNVCKCVIKKKSDDLNKLEPRIDSLRSVFRKLYPAELFEPIFESSNIGSSYMTPILDVFFTSHDMSGIQELQVQKYASIIQEVSVRLCKNTLVSHCHFGSLSFPDLRIIVDCDEPEEMVKKKLFDLVK